MSGQSLSHSIDQMLPQTQCTKCGFEGCRPYADAIVFHGAAINRCPPGGTATIEALARLTQQQVLPLDPECGTEQPLRVAVIEARLCIGCTLCIAACPVDAILGAAKQMHQVVSDDCSGCDLCIAPCPVDCITMAPAARPWTLERQRLARSRHELNGARRARIAEITAAKRSTRLAEHADALAAASSESVIEALARKRAVIDAALARARARRPAASVHESAEPDHEHDPSA